MQMRHHYTQQPLAPPLRVRSRVSRPQRARQESYSQRPAQRVRSSLTVNAVDRCSLYAEGTEGEVLSKRISSAPETGLRTSPWMPETERAQCECLLNVRSVKALRSAAPGLSAPCSILSPHPVALSHPDLSVAIQRCRPSRPTMARLVSRPRPTRMRRHLTTPALRGWQPRAGSSALSHEAWPSNAG